MYTSHSADLLRPVLLPTNRKRRKKQLLVKMRSTHLTHKKKIQLIYNKTIKAISME